MIIRSKKSSGLNASPATGFAATASTTTSSDYQGQITFFSEEIFRDLCTAFPQVQKSPGVLRRNVIVAGVDLHALIGKTFELQGVRLLGTAHCKPCYWLDQAFAPGTEAFLQGNGGLRARILTDGWIKTGAAELASAAM